MIIWLNGTFGAGKTTTASELTALLPGSRIFDTAHVIDTTSLEPRQVATIIATAAGTAGR